METLTSNRIGTGRSRLPYLQVEKTRHGKRVYYVRVGDGPRIRIPGDKGRDAFLAAYKAAVSGKPVAVEREAPARRKPEHAYVYVVGDKRGNVKIGYSTAPEKRLAALRTSHAKELTLHATYRTATADARRIERNAHACLQSVRREGEWFACTVETARKVVQTLLDGSEFIVTTDYGKLRRPMF